MTILPREERLDNCIEWLTDLLESNFVQAFHNLADGKARCCLGVGNQVAHQCLDLCIPDAGEEVNFGLMRTIDMVIYMGSQRTLWSLNDSNVSHPEIAKLVLEQPHRVLSADIVDDVKAYFTFGEY